MSTFEIATSSIFPPSTDSISTPVMGLRPKSRRITPQLLKRTLRRSPLLSVPNLKPALEVRRIQAEYKQNTIGHDQILSGEPPAKGQTRLGTNCIVPGVDTTIGDTHEARVVRIDPVG
jgi:hypothetical protein